jgi:hypothetical protein
VHGIIFQEQKQNTLNMLVILLLDGTKRHLFLLLLVFFKLLSLFESLFLNFFLVFLSLDCIELLFKDKLFFLHHLIDYFFIYAIYFGQEMGTVDSELLIHCHSNLLTYQQHYFGKVVFFAFTFILIIVLDHQQTHQILPDLNIFFFFNA